MGRIWNLSLRAALWTFIVGSLSCGATLFAMYTYFADQVRTTIERRAEATANAIDAAAAILGQSRQLERMVQALGADRDLRSIVIIDHQTQQVIAATDYSLVGTRANAAMKQGVTGDFAATGSSRTLVSRAFTQDAFVFATSLHTRDRNGSLRPSLLVVRARTDNIHANAISGMSEPGAIMITGILLTLAFYLLLLHRAILKPLTQIQRAIRKFSRGKVQTRVPPLPHNEVGILGQKLNRLLDGVVQARARVEQQNRELTAAKEEADRASRMKSDFLATMSHEIRTPLNGIIGMAQLLTMSNLPQKQAQFSRVILTSAETLLTLINDILDLSKIEAGKVNLENVGFSLHQLLAETAELAAPKGREKDMVMLLRIAPDVADAVNGDPHRIRQVVLNLASNAVKFTAKGHVCISATRVSPGASGIQKIRISVQDTGIGIPADVQSRLFTKFTQADTSTTRNYGGTGLGLAICHQLVTLMQGQIGVDSTPGQGSDFWFDLELPEDTGVLGRTPPARELARPEPVRVLVLDNTELCRTIAAESIAHAGGRCTAVADTLTALRELKPLDGSLAKHHVVVIAEMMLDAARSEGVLQAVEDLQLPLVLWANSLETDARDLPAGVDMKAVVPRPSLPGRLTDAIAAAARHRPRSVRPAAPAPENTSRLATPEAFRGKRILVVEDNRNQQVLIGRFLEMMGSKVETADEGRAGVDLWATGGFDLIVMDCQMPGMNGFDATKAIRLHEREHGLPHTPIVALTAHVMRGDRDRCLKAGMDDYLTKPMNFDDVRRVLAHYLVNAETAEPAATTPRHEAAGEMTAVPLAVAAEAAPTVQAGNRLFREPSILVVEDSEVNCEVAIATLEMMGCKVMIARSGKLAIELCRSHRFDAVLMDVQMPEMDGYETSRALARMSEAAEIPRTPIIAMTANARPSDREACLAAGMDDYLEKPIDQRLLASKLRQWLPEELHADAAVDTWVANDEATLNPVSLRSVRNIMRGRFDSYARLFLRETRRQIEHIRGIVDAEGPAEELVRTVHTLRSACSQIGANRVCAVAASLEDRAIECVATNQSVRMFQDDVEKLQSLFADVEVELLRHTSPDRAASLPRGGTAS